VPRVAITGIGLLSSLGTNREDVWRNLVNGRCGIGDVTLFDPTGYRSRLAAQFADFDRGQHFTLLEQRRWSRCDQAAVLATREALDDAGVDVAGLDPERVGVMFGAGTSDLLRNEEFFDDVRRRGVAHGRPSEIVNFFSNTPVDVVASHFEFSGPRHCVVAACSSSTIALGYAADAIRAGTTDIVVAGGADALCRLTFSGFNALRLVDTEPCRPFDQQRGGMTIGEAAAVLVLENFDRARTRGARIYAELAGDGNSLSSYRITDSHPSGDGAIQAMRQSLADAGLAPECVDYVNAHGTSTLMNDRSECAALRAVMGSEIERVCVSSTKSCMGHLIAAAGAVEAAVCALAIRDGIAPLSANLVQPDPDCAVNIVHGNSRKMRIRAALSNSFGFGGSNSSLAFRHPEEVPTP